ncbi:MAG: hypothetical protein ACLFWD_03170 [Anaerolineales bacterium]
MSPNLAFFIGLATLLLAVYVFANRRIEATRLKVLLVTPLIAASIYFIYVFLTR